MKRETTLPTLEFLDDLASPQQAPCLSLYQRTYRWRPENQQDPIRFRNLVRELETSLRQKYPAVEVRHLLEPFDAMVHDRDFWDHTLDGLAILSGPSLFRVYRLQRPVADLAVVADSFHTKPLRRFLQSVGRYQVLGLSLTRLQLFEGNRDTLDEIDLAPGASQIVAGAAPHLVVGSYGGVGHGTTPVHRGHGGKEDEVQNDTDRFFRAADRAVLEHHSRPSGLPVILAALPEHHHLFHQISNNPFLMVEGLDVNPDTITLEELGKRAWQVIEPQYQAQMASLADEFAVAKSRGSGSDDLAQVAVAAAEGKVATLLIESDRQIAGRLNRTTGGIEPTDPSDTQVDDVLDDLGELVRKMGGRVLVLTADAMPSKTGLAATYRY